MKNKLLSIFIVSLLLSSCSDYEPFTDNTSDIAVLSSTETTQTTSFDYKVPLSVTYISKDNKTYTDIYNNVSVIFYDIKENY